jgi:hypothetical protein
MSLQKGKETTTAFSSLNHTAMKSMAGSEFIKKIKTWEILENILSAPALYGIPTDALEKQYYIITASKNKNVPANTAPH